MNSRYFLAFVGDSFKQNNRCIFGNLLEAAWPAIEKNFCILRDAVFVALIGRCGIGEKSLKRKKPALRDAFPAIQRSRNRTYKEQRNEASRRPAHHVANPFRAKGCICRRIAHFDAPFRKGNASTVFAVGSDGKAKMSVIYAKSLLFCQIL